jgi:hypothetical protein
VLPLKADMASSPPIPPPTPAPCVIRGKSRPIGSRCLSAVGQKRKSSERANVFRFAPKSGEAKSVQRADYDGRLFVCSDQSGRTSAPTRPQAVQTIRGHKARTGISSGSPSAFMTAL